MGGEANRMSDRNVWQDFFDGHAPHYMENVFTANTVAEVDFALEELGLSPGSSILDIGCGTGRHSVELARRGYRMTGVDISEGMLAEAQHAAQAAGIEVEWVHQDATLYSATAQFDAAICLCEGAFGLVDAAADPEAHDTAVLSNIAAALSPGGRLVVNALNGYRKIRELVQADVETGRFDPVTMLDHVTEDEDLPGGAVIPTYKDREYIPPELVKLVESAGFRVDHVWGGTAGNWGRRPLDLDEIEVMVVATRL